MKPKVLDCRTGGYSLKKSSEKSSRFGVQDEFSFEMFDSEVPM